jgi:3-deoxy-manno-octulosonate cytidylyltransferase (CMP-KDO synthetase)
MSKIIAIIPARYNSTRLPGKVLEKIGGKTVLELVYRKVMQARNIDEVIIATDDQKIIDIASSFGAHAEMTFSSHRSGTDRCAQVSREFWEGDIIINIQGDEPFIDPAIIDLLALKMKDDDWIEIATLCSKDSNYPEISDPNTVKVVKDIYNKALYFSRATIPFNRDQDNEVSYYKHIGIYAYRNKILQSITALKESKLENAEKLEQLRWMENGYKIHVFETEYKGFGIDTMEDLEKARKMV